MGIQTDLKKFRNFVVLAAVLLIWAALANGISFYIDGLWFDSLGFWEVFELSISTRFVLFLVAGLASFLFLWGNIHLACRQSKSSGFWFRQEFIEVTQKGTRSLLILGGAGVAILAGMAIQNYWLDVLRFFHAVPVDTTDPIFNREVGFYLFTLPVYRLASSFFLTLLALTLIATTAGYLTHGHLGYRDGFKLTQAARIHLTILVSIFLGAVSWNFWLKRFEILYSRQGVVFGAGYTDLNAWLPCYWILCVLAAVIALLILSTLALRSWKAAALCAGLFALAFLALNAYPPLIQTFIVEPNELQKERPFIEHNISSTLQAYKLDEIEVYDFATNQSLDEDDLESNRGTFRNIRLWDWRPLKDSYNQLQSIRLYYDFEDVDVDRYQVNGQYRQVMLSAREFEFSKISESAQNWINQYFQYTHGHGLCLSPVNEVTEEGLPEFFIKDIPPRSSVDIVVDRPEIYFGERTNYPVFVKTDLEEFDYPIGDQNATTTYQADRGLPLNSLFTRLLFSWELGIYQIIFTGNFNEDSRVILHRNIRERIARIAPFLLFDQDPYLVIHNGRLLWMQDAYTVSRDYPYSEPYPSRSAQRFNYIRNSVKITVDAYLGDVNFYISDPEDPIIQVYERIFPSLFQPMEEMPAGLRDHIRYPVDFFDVQRELYGRYHMKDPTVFFNQEDVWEVPTELYRGNEQLMESYYVIMSLPGSDQEEFILLIPYTPRNKNNMIAWMAARSDGEHYGKLVLYQFPKQELTYGPMQIEARIDQNPDISQLITLWSQKGSRVIRGNLLVIPVEESILYVEPIYLQAEKSEIPELTRIVCVYQNQVALGETLEEALRLAILGEEAKGRFPTGTRQSDEERISSTVPLGGEWFQLVQQAWQAHQSAQENLRQGKWAAYGEDQEQLDRILKELSELGSVVAR